MWWLKLLGAMSIVTVTIRNGGSTARRRRQVASWGSTATRLSSINESLEPKILLAADITGISPGTYNVALDTAVTNDSTPTLKGTGTAAGQTVTLTYNGVPIGTGITAANLEWSIPLTADILSGATVSAEVGGFTTDTVVISIDTFVPATPTLVSARAVGGTVITNTLNSTNTHLIGSASILRGHAVGGKAEFLVNGVVKLMDNTISASDTTVTFSTSDGTPLNTELQAIFAAGTDAVTVLLYDAAGNVSGEATGPTLTVDYTAPVPEISGTSNTPTNNPVPITITFLESVTGFTSSDVTLNGGTLIPGSFLGSGAVYSMQVKPLPNSIAPIQALIAANKLTDLAGNRNTASAPATQAVDTKKPTLAITDYIPMLGNPDVATGPVTFIFTFDEPVTGFEVSDVEVVSGGEAAVGFATGVSGSSVYTLVVTPTSISTTPIKVTVAGGTAQDVVGNLTTAPVSATQAVDTKIPSVIITDNNAGVANGPVTFKFTFSEPVSGFTIEDIDVNVLEGTMSAFKATSSTVYTVLVTPTNASVQSITVNVDAGVAQDKAGNDNSGATEAVQAVDMVRPTVESIASTAGGTGSDVNVLTGNVTFTFTFDEQVKNFTASDIVVVNGSKGAFTANLPAGIFTLVVTPKSNFFGILSVSVADNVATDLALNKNIGAAAFTHAVNTRIPTVRITDNVSGTVTRATTNLTFTFTFSEAISQSLLELNGIIEVTNGDKAEFARVGMTNVYTLTVTPFLNIKGTMRVSIGAAMFSNLALNLNALKTEVSQQIDTL